MSLTKFAAALLALAIVVALCVPDRRPIVTRVGNIDIHGNFSGAAAPSATKE